MESRMMVSKASIVRVMVLMCFMGAGSAAVGAQPEGGTEAISYREFLQSLTPAERKIPINLVAASRYASGEPLPAALADIAARQAREAQTDSQVYRIEGTSSEALVIALRGEGLSPKYVSDTRNYITAYMPPSAVIALAASEQVFKITVVVGPLAQGQGSTQAAVAHRLAELYPVCLLYTSPSPRDLSTSRMPSSA